MSDQPLSSPIAEFWPAVVWTRDDTAAHLSRFPLPFTFTAVHQSANRDGSARLVPVTPTGTIHKGYGFWLWKTPYFPGLFERIHDILLRWPNDADLPDGEALAELLRKQDAAAGVQQGLGFEDNSNQ